MVQIVERFTTDECKWNTYENMDTAVAQERRAILEKYLSSCPSYQYSSWDHDYKRGKEAAYKDGNKDGFNKGRHAARQFAIDDFITFYDDIIHKLQQVDKQAKELS